LYEPIAVEPFFTFRYLFPDGPSSMAVNILVLPANKDEGEPPISSVPAPLPKSKESAPSFVKWISPFVPEIILY